METYNTNPLRYVVVESIFDNRNGYCSGGISSRLELPVTTNRGVVCINILSEVRKLLKIEKLSYKWKLALELCRPETVCVHRWDGNIFGLSVLEEDLEKWVLLTAKEFKKNTVVSLQSILREKRPGGEWEHLCSDGAQHEQRNYEPSSDGTTYVLRNKF